MRPVYFRASWLLHELDSNRLVEGACSLATFEKLADRLPTFVAVVLRQLVHVHPNEAIRETRVEVTPVLHRVGKGLRTAREPRLDRLGQHFAQLVQDLGTEVPA